MSFAARGTTYPLHSQLHLQLVSVNRLAVQLAAISASHVDDDSLVSTAHVREESNANIFQCDRNGAVKAETLKCHSREYVVVSWFACFFVA